MLPAVLVNEGPLNGDCASALFVTFVCEKPHGNTFDLVTGHRGPRCLTAAVFPFFVCWSPPSSTSHPPSASGQGRSILPP